MIGDKSKEKGEKSPWKDNSLFFVTCISSFFLRLLILIFEVVLGTGIVLSLSDYGSTRGAIAFFGREMHSACKLAGIV